mmetsp:Transcript_13190/g.33667  ORF Transcript_13190/g.33667 Transcript_13190/m.33667 type:complete len:376 (-) Transcript_13190:45-1172(-)
MIVVLLVAVAALFGSFAVSLAFGPAVLLRASLIFVLWHAFSSLLNAAGAGRILRQLGGFFHVAVGLVFALGMHSILPAGLVSLYGLLLQYGLPALMLIEAYQAVRMFALVSGAVQSVGLSEETADLCEEPSQAGKALSLLMFTLCTLACAWCLWNAFTSPYMDVPRAACAGSLLTLALLLAAATLFSEVARGTLPDLALVLLYVCFLLSCASTLGAAGAFTGKHLDSASWTVSESVDLWSERVASVLERDPSQWSQSLWSALTELASLSPEIVVSLLLSLCVLLSALIEFSRFAHRQDISVKQTFEDMEIPSWMVSLIYALLTMLGTVFILQFTGHQSPTSSWWYVAQAVLAQFYYAGLSFGAFNMYEDQPLHED